MHPGFDEDSMAFFRGKIPVHGHVPMVKQGDPEWRKPQYRHVMHVQVFDLRKDPELQAYREILQRCADGIAHLVECQSASSEDNLTRIVHWSEPELIGEGAQPTAVNGHHHEGGN